MTAAPAPRPSQLVIAGRILVVSVALLWVVEILDALLLAGRLDRHGIRPRTLEGLDGVLWAPFLHGDFGHLLANTVPFVVLGGLVLLRGGRLWTVITALVALLGGLATWVLARDAVHIGASGVVFGYLGFLFGAAVFERSLRAVLVASVVALVYGGLVFGILPTGGGVSWEGHLFGFAAGVLGARLVFGSRRRTAPTPG